MAADASDREAIDAVWKHYAKENGEQPFFKFVLSKVVSIAAVFRSVDASGHIDLALQTRSFDQRGEGQMIASFLERVATGQWQLWGFNSTREGIPILKHRAVALGAPCPTFFAGSDTLWQGKDNPDSLALDSYVDILEIIGAFSNATRPSLHELAIACGFPGTSNVTGDELVEMYIEKRIGEIMCHNEDDAVATHLIMLRLGLVAGHLTPEAYRSELDAVDALAREQVGKGKSQLAKFQGVWEREQLAVPATPAQYAQLSDFERQRRLWSDWDAFLARVKEQRGQQIRAALIAVRDLAVVGDTVYFAFGNNEFSRQMVENKREGMEQLLAEWFGVPIVTLACQLGDKAQAI